MSIFCIVKTNEFYSVSAKDKAERKQRKRGKTCCGEGPNEFETAKQNKTKQPLLILWVGKKGKMLTRTGVCFVLKTGDVFLCILRRIILEGFCAMNLMYDL